MSRRLLALALALAAAASQGAAAQAVFTYTQSQSGPNLLTYGLPVPLPIDSVTPVDGFRSYASLDARLQSLALESSDLAAHAVGQTIAGRTVWAYVVSDEDGTDVEGQPEAAFFINASTHAREWGTPEISTGTIERLVGGAGDGGLVRYVLDNTRLVILPVHNIDGLLQTQRYPTQVVVGQDPTSSNWPRDGRMRRKNMRGADENLLTFADHLNGVDLNRNHPPFWATAVGNGGSSANPNALTFHGSGPHSEPESIALRTAAQLGPATRFRLGIDVHSFSRVFFSSNTARTRLNTIQAGLIERLRTHHFAVAGKNYNDVPDPPNLGIGAAAEYFAYEWLVPAWTLEIEPLNNAVEYGGLAVNHGGFILPASQARRVREGWAESHLVAFYTMAGAPHLRRVRIFDAQSNALVRETRWQYDAASGARQQVTALDGVLLRGTRYRVELAFSKPMRFRDAGGMLTQLPGAEVPLATSVALIQGGTRTPLDTAAGTWQSDPSRVLRYRDDTFAFEFTAPDTVADLQLEVDVNDMVGHRLDADPSTPVDWSAGAWSEWEDATGTDGDVGGADRTTSLRVGSPGPLELVAGAGAGVVGEGDTVTLRFRRLTPGPERIDLDRFETNGTFPPPTTVATWMPGESGERSVVVAAPDDLAVNGDRRLDFSFQARVDGSVVQSFAPGVDLLDNDGPDLGVMRVREAGALRTAWEIVRSGAPARALVLDAGVDYTLPVNRPAAPTDGLQPLSAALSWYANGAVLRVPGDRFDSALDVTESGTLLLDRVHLEVEAETRTNEAVLRNAGRSTVARATIRREGELGASLFRNDTGVMKIERTLVDGGDFRGAGEVIDAHGGTVEVIASTVTRHESALSQVALYGGATRLSGVSLVNNSSGGVTVARLGVALPAGAVFGHTLVQDNNVSTALSPPINENCSDPETSVGFNIENYTRCGFTRDGDHAGIDLGEFAFDASIGGVGPIGTAIDGGATASEAVATGCSSVDQRGAPRPQTLTPGAVPRCDVGAIELGVNPYRGIWQPARSGHGVELHTAGNQLLLVWYTYGDDGQPTSYQAAAPLSGPHWEADLLQPRRDPATGAVTAPRVGRVSIDFAADDDATLGWRFDARGTNGSERIRPAVFASGAPRFEVSGVWYPPAESGYGATVSRRGEVTALVLYYYDAAGNIRWVLGSGNGADAMAIPMLTFTGFCPDCDAAAMPVQFQPAGSVLVHFQTPTRARLDTSISYPGPAGGTWNRQRAALVPLNDPVGNR